MFGLFGETDTISGCTIFNNFTTARRVDLVAVAVNAITSTDRGMRLRTSPSCENSLRKLPPLQEGEQREDYRWWQMYMY